MEPTLPTNLTRKGERTREHILSTALNLFVERGFEATTMREIAAAAECSLGLTYRYFRRKEDLVLALYRRVAQEFDAAVAALPTLPLAVRFELAMRAKLAAMLPYRPLLQSILGPLMSPQTEVGVLSPYTADIREQSVISFALVVSASSDPPREPVRRDMATVLHAAHLALTLYWLYDTSPDQRSTSELLTFTRDLLTHARRLLRLPLFGGLLARLARLIEPIFGGAP
ncbi:MAG: hypothetical protein OHK0022_12180 [Roseiflexaceae bacterium]